MTEHPTAEQLAALVDNGLGSGERDEIMVHLASCRRCFQDYTETTKLVGDPEPIRRPRIQAWWGLAAAAVLALSVAAIWQPWSVVEPPFQHAVDSLPDQIPRNCLESSTSGSLAFAPRRNTERAIALQRGILTFRKALADREGWNEQLKEIGLDLNALPDTPQSTDLDTVFHFGWWCEAIRVAARSDHPPATVVDLDHPWPQAFIDSIGPLFRDDLNNLRSAAAAGDFDAVEQEISGIVALVCI